MPAGFSPLQRLISPPAEITHIHTWKIEAGGDGDEEGAEGMVDGREDGGGKDVRQVEQTWDGMEMEMD